MGKLYKFSEEEECKMVDLYVNHFKTLDDMSKEFNVDRSVIEKRLIKRNIEIIKGSAYSDKYWVKRGMCEVDAKIRVKLMKPVYVEYWVNLGYSPEDAILQIEGQKMVSLRGCIARFGEIEGTKIWGERENKRSDAGKKGSVNLQYWINKGYSEEESIKLRSERQSTFSKTKCIEKYGKKEGLKVFTERQNKWQKELYKNGNLKSGYSLVSQEIFKILIIDYDTNHLNNIFFAKKGGEMVLEDDKGFYRYDFTDIKNKKIIEYNGDDYHGNPKKYKANDYPHPFRKTITAKEMWDKDKRKIKLAKEHGFDVLVVWDSEYKKNKKEIINKCKEFLK